MNTDKIVKFIEYLGPKVEKKVAGVVFKANPDFDNRKVAIVDLITAEMLLRFPKVFRELDVQKYIGESVKGQGSLLEETKPVQVDNSGDSIREAMTNDRNRIDKRAKKLRR